MTFAATQTSDLAQLLNTDHFGESADYFPVHGAGSKRTITVIVDEQELQHEKDGRSVIEHSRINVFARRNATTGIDQPRQGDRLIRASDTPPPAGTKLRQYFLSRVIDEDANGGWYEFIGKRRIENGPSVPQQDSFA